MPLIVLSRRLWHVHATMSEVEEKLKRGIELKSWLKSEWTHSLRGKVTHDAFTIRAVFGPTILLVGRLTNNNGNGVEISLDICLGPSEQFYLLVFLLPPFVMAAFAVSDQATIPRLVGASGFVFVWTAIAFASSWVHARRALGALREVLGESIDSAERQL